MIFDFTRYGQTQFLENVTKEHPQHLSEEIRDEIVIWIWISENGYILPNIAVSAC